MVQATLTGPSWTSLESNLVYWSDLDMDKIALVKKEVRHAEWAEQVLACQRSGLSVEKWCEENGIKSKTYYYRLKRVREELLCDQIPFPIGTIEPSPPVAPVPNSAVTVRVNNMTIEIADGTSDKTITAVIRALSC